MHRLDCLLLFWNLEILVYFTYSNVQQCLVPDSFQFIFLWCIVDIMRASFYIILAKYPTFILYEIINFNLQTAQQWLQHF